MKPTYKQINDLLNACALLGGTYNRIVQEGSKEQVSAVPYKYGAKSKAVRTAASHNLRLLRPQAEIYTDKRNELLSTLTDGACFIGDEPADGPLSAKFNLADRKLGQTSIEVELELLPIAEEDLNLEQNPLPTVVLEALKLIPPASPKPEA